MNENEYKNFIDRFQDKIKDNVSQEKYDSVKLFITNIVKMLDYGSKINYRNFDKLVKFGMYHTLTNYYIYELNRPEVSKEITSSILEKDKLLDLKNQKKEETKITKITKIKPIKEEPNYSSKDSISRVKQILDTYIEYEILDSNINTNSISIEIINDLKEAHAVEKDIVDGKLDSNIKYAILNSNYGIKFNKDFDNFRKETFSYLIDHGFVHYTNSESYSSALNIATKVAISFKINGIEAKDFKDSTTYKYVENYMKKLLFKSRSVEEPKESSTLKSTAQEVKNFKSKIKAVPKEKKVDAAVIAIRIFTALVILKIVQTVGNYIYDNALEKRLERQRENRPEKPKYEYVTNGVSNDGYYAIDELLHGHYNPETNEYEIGSDYVAKL